MKHYQTCTNPKGLTKINLSATSYILQCNCCGAYAEIPTPPNPAPITTDFSNLERRTAEHFSDEESPFVGDVYTGRITEYEPETIETTALSGGSVRTYILK